jgi:hypothetical protein
MPRKAFKFPIHSIRAEDSFCPMRATTTLKPLPSIKDSANWNNRERQSELPSADSNLQRRVKLLNKVNPYTFETKTLVWDLN